MSNLFALNLLKYQRDWILGEALRQAQFERSRVNWHSISLLQYSESILRGAILRIYPAFARIFY
jgi:hypothetical protein